MVTVQLLKVTDDSGEDTTKMNGYIIKNFESFSISIRTPITPMPLPEEKSDENVLVKMEGNTSTINLSWTLVNSTTDLNIGLQQDNSKTYPLGTHIRTVPEQLDYLSDTLQGSSLQEKFLLKISYSEIAGEKDLDFFGFVTSMTFSQTSSAPVTFNAQLSFIQGNVITTLDADVPNKPTSVGLSTPASGTNLGGRITATFVAPVYKGGSNSIVNYDLEFRNSSSGKVEYKKYSQTGTSITLPTGSLTNNTFFQVRVRANSSDGDGRWSSYHPITNPLATSPNGVLSSTT